MIRIVHPDSYLVQPWKNGGGITREVARQDHDGKILWRLSIADVAVGGPFSPFPGLSRILTVIEGQGIDLDTPDGTLAADPLRPVAFSGDTPVNARLRGGPIRDLNVIYDPAFIAAAVTSLTGPALTEPDQALQAFLCLEGAVWVGADPVPVGAVALFDHAPLRLAAGAAGLLVRLRDTG